MLAHDRSTIIIRAEKLNHQVAVNERQLTLLNDINLTIYQGQSVAITGASGSGKTTLLSMLAGLDTPSSGLVHFANLNVNALDEEQRASLRRERVGFIFQQFLLIPSLTALENVALSAQLKGDAAAFDKAHAWLERVGLSTRAAHYPSQLSGGEQQRVAIARAFICQPEVLFADEPSANLDHNNGRLIEDLLFELNESGNTTLILVTHDNHLAQRCQRQLRMEAGCLSEAQGAAHV